MWSRPPLITRISRVFIFLDFLILLPLLPLLPPRKEEDTDRDLAAGFSSVLRRFVARPPGLLAAPLNIDDVDARFLPDFPLPAGFFLATPSLLLAGRLIGLLDNPRPDFLRLVVTPAPPFSF